MNRPPGPTIYPLWVRLIPAPAHRRQIHVATYRPAPHGNGSSRLRSPSRLRSMPVKQVQRIRIATYVQQLPDITSRWAGATLRPPHAQQEARLVDHGEDAV